MLGLCLLSAGQLKEQRDRPTDRPSNRMNEDIETPLVMCVWRLSCSSCSFRRNRKKDDGGGRNKMNRITARHRNPSVYSLLVSPPADWFFVLRRLVVRLRDRDTGSVRTVGQGQGKTVHRQTDSTFSLPLVGLSVSSFYRPARVSFCFAGR